MSAAQIRKYLLRQPRPASLRIKCGDETTIMEIPASPHWAEIGESIDALGPDCIEMLDKKGTFIRAVKSDQFDDEIMEDVKANSRQAAGKVAFDAETERFKLVANLLAEAHKFSETAFNQLAKIVEGVTTSNVQKDKFIDSMQRAYNKALMDNAELVAQSGGEEGGGDPMELMFRMMMAGAMSGQQERTTVGNAVGNAVGGAVGNAVAQAAKKTPTNGKARN
jgi:hypothetical protein